VIIQERRPGCVVEVTVVVPTHNRRELLVQTLRSLIWQRAVALEIVVVDDGSTDDTAAVVAGLGDRRLRLLRHETPQGVSVARNWGIAEAKGQWIAFCDDDDLWAPDKLALQLKALRDSGRTWVYTGDVIVTTDLQVVGGRPPFPPDVVAHELPRRNLIPGGCSGVLVSGRTLPLDGPFDRSYRHFADWDLWIRLAQGSPPAWVCRPLVGYRIHPGNASHDTKGMVAELAVIEGRYGVRVDRELFYRYVARVSMRGNRRWQALGYYARAAGLGRRDYVLSEFFPDVWEVVGGSLGSLVRRAGRRLGFHHPWLYRPRRVRRYEADADWRDEAQTWVKELAADTGEPVGGAG
jgi:glycosyltransferase involved in cell wall biosynthesis